MADFEVPDKDLLTSVDRSADSFLIYDASASALKRTTADYLNDLTSHPVGVDDTQTLTNKIITSPSVSSPVLSGTLTGTYTLGGTPTFPSSVVTLTGSQTLTNKVLTSPTINNAVVSNPTLTVDAISEHTGAAGVTIDGVLLKDSKVNGSHITDATIDTLQLKNDSVTASKIDWASTGADAGIWWEELGRTTLGSAGDTITVSSIPARKYLRVKAYIINSGSVNDLMRFNNDGSNNYSRRTSANGAADATGTSSSATSATTSTSTPFILEYDVINVATQEKMIVGHKIDIGLAGAATAPGRVEVAGKWANTADQITRVDLVNTSLGDYAIGSEIVILGHN